MPKITTNPTKLLTVLGYFHKSGVAHSIKDLEKALPSIASINSMAVKDYLQALSDENKIRVEKIGSGNWYWAFAGEEKASKERELGRAEEERGKVEGVVAELRERIEEAVRCRTEGEGEGEEGMDRAEGMLRVEELKGQVESLKKELKAYSGNDPEELEMRKKEVEELKRGVEASTDAIYSMENYMKNKLGMDREMLDGFKKSTYGKEWSEEDAGLKEL